MASVFITCAVTGSGDTVGKSDKVPVTPTQIADDCIAAAKAGAAIVHIHVRDPLTGKGARHPELYAEVVDRVRISTGSIRGVAGGREFEPKSIAMSFGVTSQCWR